MYNNRKCKKYIKYLLTKDALKIRRFLCLESDLMDERYEVLTRYS